MKEVTCARCDYKWKPKVENPKTCTRCKQYMDWEGIIKSREAKIK